MTAHYAFGCSDRGQIGHIALQNRKWQKWEMDGARDARAKVYLRSAAFVMLAFVEPTSEGKPTSSTSIDSGGGGVADLES